MIPWPDDLVRDIAARRAIVFMGAGVSRNSTGTGNKRPPDWIGFLTDGIKDARSRSRLGAKDARALQGLVDQRDLLTVCDVLKSVLSATDFAALVRRAYLTPAYKPAQIHEYIWKLDCRIVLTPNFDQIYDGYALSVSGNSAIIKSYSDNDLAETLRETGRVIIKMHGSVSSPHNLIFTRAEYAAARTRNRAFYSLIESLLRTSTFLFLGCGLDDPDIRMLLENYTYDYEHSRKHYFVLPSDSLTTNILDVLAKSLNLEFLQYLPADHHKDLTISVKSLVQKVELKRTEMGATQTW